VAAAYQEAFANAEAALCRQLARYSGDTVELDLGDVLEDEKAQKLFRRLGFNPRERLRLPAWISDAANCVTAITSARDRHVLTSEARPTVIAELHETPSKFPLRVASYLYLRYQEFSALAEAWNAPKPEILIDARVFQVLVVLYAIQLGLAAELCAVTVDFWKARRDEDTDLKKWIEFIDALPDERRQRVRQAIAKAEVAFTSPIQPSATTEQIVEDFVRRGCSAFTKELRQMVAEGRTHAEDAQVDSDMFLLTFLASASARKGHMPEQDVCERSFWKLRQAVYIPLQVATSAQWSKWEERFDELFESFPPDAREQV
jgi:hypothetical protein